MLRALLPPFLSLALVLLGLAAFEANRDLGLFLLEEARLLAGFAAQELPLEALGVRRTPYPQNPLPLLGEGVEDLRVEGLRLEALAAQPAPGGAVEARRTRTLFLPSPLPLLLALPFALWGILRAQGAVRRALGLPLGEAREQLAALSAALEALEEGVLVLKGETVVLLNAKARRLLGLPEGALPPFALRRAFPALEGFGEGEGFLPLPTSRPARVRVREGAYRVAVFQDQAELLRLAESLTQSRRHLELLRAQAHEFQNLLHLLGGLLELGRTEEALRLLHAELEAEGGLEALLAQVELPLVAALLLGKARRARELGVGLEVKGRLPAYYAPLEGALVAVLGHLLENALEAAGAGGEVAVAFQEEGGLWLEVRDNGPGVPEAAQAQLFRPGASARGPGRGYGLALARAQAEAHGGEMGYRREGGWTVFYAFFRREGWTGPSS